MPDGRRRRRYIAGQSREEVKERWQKLRESARRGPMPSKSPTVESYMTRWLATVVRPGLAPSTAKGLHDVPAALHNAAPRGAPPRPTPRQRRPDLGQPAAARRSNIQLIDPRVDDMRHSAARRARTSGVFTGSAMSDHCGIWTPRWGMVALARPEDRVAERRLLPVQQPLCLRKN